MTPWVVLAVYVVGWVTTARLVHGALEDDPDQDLATPMVATVWPLAIAFFALAGLYTLITMPWPKPRLPRLRRRRQADQERIQELEQALGMDRDV